ncbi:MAG: endopeptidase La [Spirochaetaceae bacterium]|jgi:ATP-dependent Lon protease|nr:endopeptidase La [Spirochaetaceae bacterium]
MKYEGVSKLLSAITGRQKSEEFPLLPLRELVIFPQTIVPLYISYKAGINAIEAAGKNNTRFFAVPFKVSPPAPVETPDLPVLYGLGAVVRMVQHLKLPDGSCRAVFHGEYRGRLLSLTRNGPCARVTVAPLELPEETKAPGPQRLALIRSVQKAFIRYAEYSRRVGTETLSMTDKTDDPEYLCNIIANALAVKTDKKVMLLDHTDTDRRLEFMLETLELENEILGIQKNISVKVRNRMEKNHREFILQEQLREINKELGNGRGQDEFAELEKAIRDRDPGEEVLLKTGKELARLRKLQPLSPEAGVLRGYLEWIADLPWKGAGDFASSPEMPDGGREEPAKAASLAAALAAAKDEGSRGAEILAAAERILEADHYGMEKAKERILEFIAVRELSGGESRPLKGPILCFVGPPGTGKTSLGKSVARALNRRFVRISLGGLRDEAEIRGHRKTYVGALPGKIIQSMRRAETVNPVFLLDEIDKLSSDFRGDPASALLEVLDPEQNNTFTDHYLEVPYDLSRVLFIATANSLHTVPFPLLDRMELIEIPGYGEREKLAIAKRFLIPKQLDENGLGNAAIRFEDDAILRIIRHWTMESGVRGLEREIARCARKLARRAVENGYIAGEIPAPKTINNYKKTVKPGDLEKLLGRRKYKQDLALIKEERVGVAYGLAWTETGGAILPVETKSYEGNGELIITGNLGDVMKESARTALSYLRSEQRGFRFLVKDIGKTDFHIHIPEGAIPKDGPSAGITLAASLLSTLCGKAPRAGIVMTGELTLTGRILPVGGLKEKILAAVRSGMDRVLLPAENREDWAELDKDIRSSIEADFIDSARDAFKLLFNETIYSPIKARGGNSKTLKRAPKKDS